MLWRTTVDELFAGERAEEAKAHALRVGAAFHSRLQTLPTAEDAAVPAPASGLTVTQHGAPRPGSRRP
jgi:hemoglobin